MAIDWTAVEDAFFDTFSVIDALADTNLVWNRYNVVRPDGPYVAMSLTQVNTVGRDGLYPVLNLTGQEEGDINFTQRGMRDCQLNLQAFADPSGATRPEAIIHEVLAQLQLPSVRDAFNAAGIGILSNGPVASIDGAIDRPGAIEPRASVDIRFSLVSERFEAGNFIQKVQIENETSGEQLEDVVGSRLEDVPFAITNEAFIRPVGSKIYIPARPSDFPALPNPIPAPGNMITGFISPEGPLKDYGSGEILVGSAPSGEPFVDWGRTLDNDGFEDGDVTSFAINDSTAGARYRPANEVGLYNSATGWALLLVLEVNNFALGDGNLFAMESADGLQGLYVDQLDDGGIDAIRLRHTVNGVPQTPVDLTYDYGADGVFFPILIRRTSQVDYKTPHESGTLGAIWAGGFRYWGFGDGVLDIASTNWLGVYQWGGQDYIDANEGDKDLFTDLFPALGWE